MAELPNISASRLRGIELFHGGRLGNGQTSLLGYWQWAHSDLLANTERGTLAEYLVAMAIGRSESVRMEWEPYDLTTEAGVRLEVKSSAYIQTWRQSKLSRPTFSIREAHYWDKVAGKMDSSKKRQADVYVFALLHHLDKTSIDPLDIAQWTFFVLAAGVLDEKVTTQKTISLSRLGTLGAEKCTFDHLSDAIEKAERIAGRA